ncbi:MAG: efflux RND transporter periplasmic adaptor subunit [Desulfobacteraceae bacterium]|nr:MAG: efflux RND transporter periplasmic adaptor subunit [Desulfobacteraceae bacterium]
MRKMKKIRMVALAGVTLAALMLTGCDEIGKLISSSKGPGQGPGGPGGPGGPPEVSVISVTTQKITLTTELPGRNVPFRIAEIRPQVNGLILKRLFTEGSNVKAGQVLYQIDPAPFQAALDNAEAALGRSEANLAATRLRAERYKELLADKAVSQQNYDDAAAALTQIEADIQSWQATVKTARINLEYTRITAPISGRIGRSSVTDGAIVTAYQPMALATIQQLDPIYVDVPRSTTEMQRLKEGGLNRGGSDQNRVKLVLEDGLAYPHEGELQFSDVSVDPTTGSVILRMVFPNPEGILLPEMFVRAVVTEGVNEQAILIPQQSVSRNQKGEPFALIVDAEGKAVLRMLTLDRAIGPKWLVSAGLAPGDSLIVEGSPMLRPGMPVKAVPYKEAQIGDGPTADPNAQSEKQSEGGA